MKYLYNLTEISTPITLSKVHQTTFTFTTNNITNIQVNVAKMNVAPSMNVAKITVIVIIN